MSTGRHSSRMQRLFRHLLALFPAAFRARYGEEMQTAFDRQWEVVKDASPLRRFEWVVATLADTAVSGIRQRMAGGPDRGRSQGSTFIDAVLQALRFTGRSARRAPGFTLYIVVTLGLGIGATTMMYGIIDRLLLRPPEHIVDPEHVVRLYVDRISPFLHEHEVSGAFSYPDLVDLESLSGFSAIAGFSTRSYTLGAGSDAERVQAQIASAALFDLLGVRPELGRFYGADEDRISGGVEVAVLSDAFWARRFGRDAGILGRQLRVGPSVYTVVGVAPPGFTGASIDPVDIWLPLLTTRTASSLSDAWQKSRNSYWFEVVARLGDSRAPQAAEAEATAAHRAGREGQIATGRYDPEARIILTSLIPGRSPDAGSEVPVAQLLAGVAFMVMLIACANVANLLLLRGVRRRREMAIRVALGISRRRLFLQLLAESLILAFVSAVAAVLLARWGGALVYRTLLPNLDPGHALGSPRLLAFAALAAGAAALLAGMVPATLASRPDVQRDLKEAGRGMWSRRLRSALVVFQVALSVVLLAGAGLFVRSLAQVDALDLGFVPERVVVGTVEIEAGASSDRTAWAVTDAMERLHAVPGIEAVAVSSLTPFGGRFWGLHLQRADGDSVSLPRGPLSYVVSPDYFRVMGMRLVRGRGFVPADALTGAPPVMVLTEGLARRVFGGSDPLGQCLLVDQKSPAPAPCTEVVGILADHRSSELVEDASLVFYLTLGHPAAQEVNTVVARGSGDVTATLAIVRAALLEGGAGVRYARVQPLADGVDSLTRSWRLGATLFSLFGALALGVAALGLHAVVGFEVAQQRSELGIRAALGAGRGRLVTAVLRSALLRAACGSLLGLVVLTALSGLGRDLLFRTSAGDPAVLALSCLTLIAIAAAAAVRPAVSAARVPPTEALRSGE